MSAANGSRSVEIELGKRLDRAGMLLWGLESEIVDGVRFDDDAAELAEFGEWCRETAATMRSLLTLDKVEMTRGSLPDWWESSLPYVTGWHVSAGPVSAALPPAGGEEPVDRRKHFPTQQELIKATKQLAVPAISATVFRELMREAARAGEIRKTKNGEKCRPFHPHEVRALLAAAERLEKRDRARMKECWAPFTS